MLNLRRLDRAESSNEIRLAITSLRLSKIASSLILTLGTSQFQLQNSVNTQWAVISGTPKGQQIGHFGTK